MKNLLNYNLQLFAEEMEGVNEGSEIAEQNDVEESETQVEESDEGEGDAKPIQSAEDNARFAAMRRRAEEQAMKKVSSNYDSRIAELCQGIKHPITGQPITTFDGYMDALNAQKRQERESELRSKGVDPDMIDKMIADSPVVRQAMQVIQKSKADEADNALLRDIETISQYDKSIKSVEDLAKLPNFNDILDRVRGGSNVVDAYKAVNFDAIMKHQNESARQQAINEMRGKAHLGTPNGVAVQDSSVDVPMEILNRYRSEGKTDKQIKELYNTVLKKLNLK